MSLINGMRLVSALSGGAMSSAALTTAIAQPAGLAAWKAAIASPTQRYMLIEDAAARAAWMGSTTASTVFMAFGDAVQELFECADGLSSLLSTQSTLNAMWSSNTVRAQLWRTEVALKAFAGTPSAITAAINSPSKKTVTAWFESASVEKVVLGSGKYFLLGVNVTGGSANVAITGEKKALSSVGVVGTQLYVGVAIVSCFMPLDGRLLAKVNNTSYPVTFHYMEVQ